MEPGFIKATSDNLPKVDSMMVANFFATNADFCSAEFRNVKTSKSSRDSYGDDAVGYVQLKRVGKVVHIQSKVCPEHKVRASGYKVVMEVDEEFEAINSVKCMDCPASEGGCKHAVAFLMWVHRRSEEPSCTSSECYWKKSRLSRVGSTLKAIKIKDLCRGKLKAPLVPNHAVFREFIDEGRKRKIEDCQLLKKDSMHFNKPSTLSLHFLASAYKEQNADDFIEKIKPLFKDSLLEEVERRTKDQSNSHLWFDLRYGRITASRAYEVSRCKTIDGTLVSTIMGGKVPDTPAMQRGRQLEDKVRSALQKKMGQPISRSGILISGDNCIFAGSPDGICGDAVVEIKCPTSQRTYTNYAENGVVKKKFYSQVQFQMYLAKKKKGYFCVADPDFENTSEIEVISINYDEDFVEDLLDNNFIFWKKNIYPLLYSIVVVE